MPLLVRDSCARAQAVVLDESDLRTLHSLIVMSHDLCHVWQNRKVSIIL